MKRPLLFALALLFAAKAAPAAPLDLEVSPALGQGAPTPSGWTSYVVTVRARAPVSLSGTVEVANADGAALVRAPFAVAGGETVTVDLAVKDALGQSLEVVARGAYGESLARASAPSLGSSVPALFDATPGSRLPVALRDERIAPETARIYADPTEGLTLAITTPVVDARGAPILPSRSFGYSGATVTAMRTDLLVSLPEPEARALTDWVVTGGTLALVVSREEDLRHPRVVELVGPGVRREPDPAMPAVVEFRTFATAGNGAPPAPPATTRIEPAAAVREALVKFAGGRVESRLSGHRAVHGLGEVELLAFDPNAPLFVDDPWVRRTLVELVRRAWDRQARVALAGGVGNSEEYRLTGLRRLVDPNERGSWSVGLSSLVLLAYALVAIPILFRRATRRGRPLDALVHLPAAALVTVALIVAIGAVAKGGRARARHVTLIECGAGSTRCAETRFRAFFASSADAMRVDGTSRGALLSLTGTSHTEPGTLVLERGGARLENLRGRPWETILVRQDAMLDLGGGVRFEGPRSAPIIVNDSGRDLLAVTASSPSGELRFFRRIANGTRVELARGDSLGTFTPPVPPGPVSMPGAFVAPRPPRSLESYRFATQADAAFAGTGAAIGALELAPADATDWWPEGAISLLGAFADPDHAPSDSGLPLEESVVLVRVVGKELPP